MDILAARKKAAEKARSRKEPEAPAPPAAQDAAPPAEETPQPPDRAETPPAPAEPAPSAPEPPAAEAATATAAEEAAADGEEEGERDEDAEAAVPEIEMLSFRLGGEAYAVTVEDVREVLKPRDLTMVPNAPAYILGIMSLRGTMLPVIDLCARLGIPGGVRSDKARIIVVSPGEEEAGLLVDRVTGVFRITEDDIKPAPEHIEHGGEFLRGIARRGETLYILLDLVKALEA